MSQLSRRQLLAGGGVVLAPAVLAAQPVAAAPPGGELVTLLTPIRLFDSRRATGPLAGRKLATGSSVIVTVAPPDEDRFLVAAFVNVTITQTEGTGSLVVVGSDPSGERPFPETVNVTWSRRSQTKENLVLTPVGSEFGIEIFAVGRGRTHVVVDLQGYVPFSG